MNAGQAHADPRRGSNYVFGGPVLMQRIEAGLLELCVWRQDLVTGQLDVRPVTRDQWPVERDPAEAFEDDDAAPRGMAT